MLKIVVTPPLLLQKSHCLNPTYPGNLEYNLLFKHCLQKKIMLLMMMGWFPFTIEIQI